MSAFRWQRGVKWTAGVLGGMVLLVAGTLAVLLGTAAGRSWTAETLAPYLAEQAGYELTLEEVQSGTPGMWKIGRLRLMQREETLLTAQTLTLRWQPEALWQERIHIHELSVAELTLQRLPEASNGEEKKEETENQKLPELMPLIVEELTVQTLTVSSPLLPETQRYTLEGNAALFTGETPVELGLSLETLEGVPLTVSVTTHISQDKRAELTGSVREAPGGILGQWIRQTEGKPVEAEFTAEVLRENQDAYRVRLKQLDTSYAGHALTMEGDASVQVNQEKIQVERLTVQTADRKQQLSGEISRERLDLEIALEAFPLSLFSGWVEPSLQGALTAKVEVTGAPESPLFSGTAEAEMRYRDMPLSIRAAGKISPLQADFSELEVVSGDARLVAGGQADIKNRQVDGKVTVEMLPVSMLRKLGVAAPLEIEGDISGSFEVKGPWKTPRLDGKGAFEGTYDAIPLHLSVQGKGSPEKFTLDTLKLTTEEGGQLKMHGRYEQPEMDFILKARGVPTALFSAVGWSLQPGSFQADLQLTGTPDRPVLEGDATFRSAATVSSDTPDTAVPIDLRAEIQTVKGQLKINGKLMEGVEERGSWTLSLPLQTYLNVDPDAGALPLKGTVTADLELSYLQLFLRAEHKLRGALQADVTLDGDLADPVIEGTARLENGYYENFYSGTVLHDISANVTADMKELKVREARATDGAGGTITLSGRADWSGGGGQAVDFTLKANEARLLRRHDMEGVVNGGLTLQGDWKEMTLAGTLAVRPFTLRLNLVRDEDIPELQVTEVYAEEGEEAKAPLDSALPVVNLDVTLKAEQQAYLRGRGVEAELQGSVALGGTLRDTQYSGSFQTIRGHYQVLGKKFTLQKGQVRFDGDSILLLIVGIHETAEVEVRAELSGTLESLELSLSSTPAMPESEILSQLLFGTPSGDISPLQAIRLANAVNKLRTGGSGLFDPVEATRDLLGVDTVTVDGRNGGNGQGMTVGVGKYLSENVYFELERGNNPALPWKGTIEIELLPNLSLESSTGGEAGFGGIELQWKRDY